MGLVSAARFMAGLIITVINTITLVYLGILLAVSNFIIGITNNIIQLFINILLIIKQSIVRTILTIESIFALFVRIIQNVVHRIYEIKSKIVESIFKITEIVALSVFEIMKNIINRIRRFEIVQIIGSNLVKVEFIRSRYERFTNPRTPPGPWGYPIVGNLLQMGDNMGETLLEWKEVYGPIISVRFGSFNAVVFNDFESVRENFARPACNGRKEVAYFKGVVNGKGIKFGKQNESLDELREFMTDRMNEFGLEPHEMQEFIQPEIRDLLALIDLRLGLSAHVHHLFKTVAVNPILNSLTQRRFHLGDQILERLADICEGILGLPPSGFRRLAHFIPWLGWILPCPSGYKSRRRRYRELVQFMEGHIAEVDLMRLGPGDPRHVSDAFKDKLDETLDENSCFFRTKNNHPYTFCDLFIGAIDTTSTLLEWALLYLAVHTDVQKTLQLQIDRRIKDARLPSLADRPGIPYAEAIFYEVIRKAPLIAINFGREALEDVEIGNYTIPKGTMLVANFYGLCMDKDVWGDPEDFRPKRFLDEDGDLDVKNMLPFSIGSRACFGGSTAKDQFFLVITSIFQKYGASCLPGKVTLKGKFGYVVHPDSSNEVVFHARHREDLILGTTIRIS